MLRAKFLLLLIFSLLISSCSGLMSTATPDRTVEELINILFASDPEVQGYDPGSKEFAEFPDTLEHLSTMGSEAIDAASHIAHSISYPRQDSYLAAEALISLGSNIAGSSIPILLDNLKHHRPEVRSYSAMVLGSIGPSASCAVGEISPLLSNSDPYVRSAAAIALDSITREDLVTQNYKLAPGSLIPLSIPEDIPEGSIVGTARIWWTENGSKINWHPSYGICDP